MFINIVRINDEFSFDCRQTWDILSDPFEDHYGEEDAAEGQSMVKHKAAELSLEEKKMMKIWKGTEEW